MFGLVKIVEVHCVKDAGLIMVDYSKYWIAHLRIFNNPNPFPRQVGEPFRSYVLNEKQYLDWIIHNNGKKECYVAVYSEQQRKEGIIDTILVDVDSLSFGFKLWRYLQYTNVYPRVMYSGKGLHMFMDFDPIKLSRPSLAIREWARRLPMRDVGKEVINKRTGRKVLKPFIDPNVIGDTNRVSRIPYTVNTRVKPLMSCYLSDDIGEAQNLVNRYILGDLKEPPLCYPESKHNNVSVATSLLEFDKQETPMVSKIIRQFTVNEKQLMAKKMLEEYPPCISEYLEKIRDTGELDHYQRLQLVTFLNRVGYDEEAIVNVFRKYARDFNERVTRYQVSYVIRRNLKMRGCLSALGIGICPFNSMKEQQENCIFFPSMNWFTVY
jgi:hypothetical protein